MFNFITTILEILVALGVFVILCWIACFICAVALIVIAVKLLARIFSDFADGHEYRKIKRYKKHVDRYKKKHDIY